MALEGSDSVRSQTLRVAQASKGKGQGEDPAAKQQQAGAGEAAAGGWPQGLNHPGPDAQQRLGRRAELLPPNKLQSRAPCPPRKPEQHQKERGEKSQK